VSWEERIIGAMLFLFCSVAAGLDVLVHCRQGRHRSGGWFVVAMAMLLYWTSDLIWQACVAKVLEMYIGRHPDEEYMVRPGIVGPRGVFKNCWACKK
jgi:hypothetical protein